MHLKRLAPDVCELHDGGTHVATMKDDAAKKYVKDNPATVVSGDTDGFKRLDVPGPRDRKKK